MRAEGSKKSTKCMEGGISGTRYVAVVLTKMPKNFFHIQIVSKAGVGDPVELDKDPFHVTTR